MSVIAFYGDGGSGKGYSQFELLLKAVESGIPVVTTIEPTPEFYARYPEADVEFIEPEIIKNADGDLVELKSIIDFSKPKRGAFYILQEVHKIYDKTTMLQPFAVGFYMNKLPPHVNVFFSERRHFVDFETGRSIQISFDTQSPLFVAKWLKAHVETAIYCYKHLELGSTGLFKRLTYTGDSAKTDTPKKVDLSNRKLAIPYKKSVYSLYKKIR
jgi:zona occludens toxin (predicted ATPase)